MGTTDMRGDGAAAKWGLGPGRSEFRDSVLSRATPLPWRTAQEGPRVLILSASAGAGHGRAAEAVAAALRLLCPAASVRHVDALTLATRAFRRCYGQMYLEFIDSHPLILKYFYTCMDEPRPVGSINHWDR